MDNQQNGSGDIYLVKRREKRIYYFTGSFRRIRKKFIDQTG